MTIKFRLPPGAERVAPLQGNAERVASLSQREILEACYVEADLTKQLLRMNGYGVTGTGLFATVMELIETNRRALGEA